MTLFLASVWNFRAVSKMKNNLRNQKYKHKIKRKSLKYDIGILY